MTASASAPAPARRWLLALDGFRLLLALRLAVPAVVLRFGPGAIAEFHQTGAPDWWRIALAVSEIAGAGLFAVRATTSAGTIILGLDLAGAIALHWHLGRSAGALCYLLPIVALTGLLQHRSTASCRND